MNNEWYDPFKYVRADRSGRPVLPPGCPGERRLGQWQGIGLALRVAALTALSIAIVGGMLFLLTLAILGMQEL